MDMNEKTTYRLMCENKGALWGSHRHRACLREEWLHTRPDEPFRKKSILATSLEKIADILA